MTRKLLRPLKRPSASRSPRIQPSHGHSVENAPLREKFGASLQSELEETRKSYKLKTKNDAFPYWVCSQILDANDTEVAEACAPEGGNDKGIDFLFIDTEESRITIGQAKYNESLNVNVKESHVNATLSCLSWLRSPDLLRTEGNFELAQLAEEYLEGVKSGFSTEIWFIYTASEKAHVERQILAFNTDTARNHDGVKARHIHLEALMELWGDLNYLPARVPEAVFKPLDNKIIEQDGAFGKAAICSLKGSDLKLLYEQHRDKLFERNVRLYLGSKKGSVNWGIENTLKDPDELGNFWSYNNGISVLADSFEISEDKSSIVAKNISIINGCQTSVSIAKFLPPKADINVLARIICADRRIVDNLIQFNNSQNQVRAWDVAAQDITQRRLRDEFAQLKTPYIYITRRGTRPKADLKKFRNKAGKLRQIRFDEAGQCIASFRGDPLLAYKSKPEIFSSRSKDVFYPNIQPEEVLFYWLAGQAVSQAIAESLNEQGINKFVLRRGGKMFVLWVMGVIFTWRNGNSFRDHLTEERVLGKPMAEALSKYAMFATTLYSQAFEAVSAKINSDTNRLNWSQKFLDDVKAHIQVELLRYKATPAYINEALPPIFKGTK